MRVYISGPISSDTTRTLDQKRTRFAIAAAQIAALGFEPVDPFTIGPACADDPCRHGTPEPAAQDPAHSWPCFLRADLIALLGCDGVATLPGWEHSEGANLEVNTARAVGILVAPIDHWQTACCARCGQPSFAHLPGGPRDGCTFAGIGSTAHCSECGRVVRWDGHAWSDDPANPRAIYCPGSNDPLPVHVPVESGDLRS